MLCGFFSCYCVLCVIIIMFVCCVTASGPSKDMLPGPYPRTPEEMAAAAKKYNMMLEDYKPHPDDGMG